MKIKCFLLLVSGVMFILSCAWAQKKPKEPWTENQLVNPADLAKILRDTASHEKPLIYSVGPADLIKGAIQIGPAKVQENLEKFKQALERLSADAEIIIYCGCCPFKDCPNIRPAFQLLKEMKFTRPKLLNIGYDLRIDWKLKGYPMNDYTESS